MRIYVYIKERMRLHSIGVIAILVVVLQSVAFSVSATPIFVNETLNDLDVTVESSLLGLKAMAFIKNNESAPILCHVTFKNGPELPRTRRDTINPGVKKVIEANMHRGIVKLTIDVVCEKK